MNTGAGPGGALASPDLQKTSKYTHLFKYILEFIISLQCENISMFHDDFQMSQL